MIKEKKQKPSQNGIKKKDLKLIAENIQNRKNGLINVGKNETKIILEKKICGKFF